MKKRSVANKVNQNDVYCNYLLLAGLAQPDLEWSG